MKIIIFGTGIANKVIYRKLSDTKEKKVWE